MKLCSPCPMGSYVSTACSNSTDTVCSPCVVCNNMEYESQPCANGLNTVCNTCKKCLHTDEAVIAHCTSGLYYWWYLENCCKTSEGTIVRCPDKTKADMAITASQSYRMELVNSRCGVQCVLLYILVTFATLVLFVGVG